MSGARTGHDYYDENLTPPGDPRQGDIYFLQSGLPVELPVSGEGLHDRMQLWLPSILRSFTDLFVMDITPETRSHSDSVQHRILLPILNADYLVRVVNAMTLTGVQRAKDKDDYIQYMYLPPYPEGGDILPECFLVLDVPITVHRSLLNHSKRQLQLRDDALSQLHTKLHALLASHFVS